MKIVVNISSMIPIYIQIEEQIKTMIVKNELKENDILPSVRALAKDLRISALTVKKAYDDLETEGFTITVHGKGTYVAKANGEALRENRIKEIEKKVDELVKISKQYEISKEELMTIIDMSLDNQ